MKSPLIDISSTPQQSYKKDLLQVVSDNHMFAPIQKVASDKLTLDVIKQVSSNFNDSSYNSIPLLSLKVAPCMSSSTKIESNSSIDSDAHVTLRPALSTKLMSTRSESVADTSKPNLSDPSENFGGSTIIGSLTRFLADNGREVYSHYILPACFFITGILLMFYVLHLA